MLKRTTPMKRTGFAPRAWVPRPAKQIDYTPRPRAVAVAVAAVARAVVSVPKVQALQHDAYMDIVRNMPCARCGKPPPSVFCHTDQGKGTGIKTDCRYGWPGCPPCHEFVGSTGKLGKQGRREFEEQAGRATRLDVLKRGVWPKTLPLLTDEGAPS